MVERKIQLKIKANNLILLDENGKEDFGVKLQFSLYATLATAEMENKKERFKRARERNNREGKYNGGKLPLFGYGVDECGYFIVNEDESKIVKEIFTAYASGRYSITQLAIEMNERGYKRRGKRFSVDVIKVWLNYWDRYCGVYEAMKYPPILSKKLGTSVRDMLISSRKNRTRAYKHLYFANKLIKCKCGSYMTAMNLVYDCTKRSKSKVREIAGLDQCEFDGNSIKISVLDGILWNISKECHRQFLQEMDSHKREELNAELKVMMSKMTELESQEEKLKVKKKRLAQSYILDALDEDEMNELRCKLEEQDYHLRMKKNTCSERISTIQRLVATDKDDAWFAQNRYLTLLNLDLEGTEKEMYDLVHKYIVCGEIYRTESDIIGFDKYKCVKIVIKTIYRDEFEFWHFGKVKNNIKTWTKDEDGNYVPYWFDEVIRTEKGITFRNSL